MRLFIAIGFPRMNDYFKRIQNQIDSNNAKFGFVDSFHLTLKFLGNLKEEKVQEIIDSLKKIELKKIDFDKFSFNFDNIGFFENRFGINVIWQGIRPSEKVIELNKIINMNLNNFKEDFRFHPHITLARVRNVIDKNLLIDNLNNLKFEALTINVDCFHLIKSELTSNGPVYEIIETFNFI